MLNLTSDVEKLDVMAYALDPSTQDAEAGGAVWVWALPGLHDKLRAAEDTQWDTVSVPAPKRQTNADYFE